MIIDLHTHTVYTPGCLIAPEDLIEQALNVGLDGICVLEHLSLKASQVTEDFTYGTPLKVFRGVEAHTDQGHLLIYGVTEAQWQRFEGLENIPAQHLIDCVRDWGGVCIPAHPFRFQSASIGEKVESLVGIFAIEGYNGRADIEENKQAQEYGQRLNLRLTGGSDAYVVGQVGRCVTVFERKIETSNDLVAELKAGRFEARYLFL